jgi:hypothetical protein
MFSAEVPLYNLQSIRSAGRHRPGALLRAGIQHGDHIIVILYQWLSRRGEAVIDDWVVEEQQARQLRVLLVSLEGVDFEVANGSLIFKTKEPGVYYSKINGNVALRPRCCLGPALDDQECRAAGISPPSAKEDALTYLERVNKRGGQETPSLRDSAAAKRIDEIENSRVRRSLITRHRRAIKGRS